MTSVRRTIRRIGAAAAAVAMLAAVAHAAPASADLNFGAGNLPGMEFNESGALDYAVSFTRCPDGYECQLTLYASSGVAQRNVDFTSNGPVSRVYKPGDGRMIGVLGVSSIDDNLYEGDEPLFVNARVEYYRGGCEYGIGRSGRCVPESEMLWKAIVRIDDNDSKFSKIWVNKGFSYKSLKGASTKSLGKARVVRARQKVMVPFDFAAAQRPAQTQSAQPAPEAPATQPAPQTQQTQTTTDPGPATTPAQTPTTQTPTPPADTGTIDYGNCVCGGSSQGPR